MKMLIGLLTVTGLSMTIAFSALAAETTPATKMDDKKDKPAVTAEQREKMASMHEKVATCLRSTKPFEECHEEMKKEHEEMMAEHKGMMAEHKGMMHDMKCMKDKKGHHGHKCDHDEKDEATKTETK